GVTVPLPQWCPPTRSRSATAWSRCSRRSREALRAFSFHRVPAVLHAIRVDPFGQRHDQEARQRLDIGLVHRAQGPELGDGGLVRAKPNADGSDEVLEAFLF